MSNEKSTAMVWHCLRCGYKSIWNGYCYDGGDVCDCAIMYWQSERTYKLVLWNVRDEQVN